MKKTAVILFNLGGPDSREAIKPFLFNFFMDRNIIAAPLPVRYLLAKWIAFKRGRNEAGDSYARLGNKSPLLDNTLDQASALQKNLGDGFKVFVCMRYWHPMAEEIAHQIKQYRPDHIVLLPLYPQFSTTTSKSSFEAWDDAAQPLGLDKVPTSRICCYPYEDGFISASVRLISEKMTGRDRAKTRLLFSAHGLPEKIIKSGDPYQYQCEQTAAKIAECLGDRLDWQLCYQSRVGPLKWIGPSTEEAIAQAAKEGKDILIYPLAFVSEHVETLVEIEEEYRHLAQEQGVKTFIRVPTVSVAPEFIEGLAQMVCARMNDTQTYAAPESQICPENAEKCCRLLWKQG